MNILQRARKNIVLKFISEALIRSLAFLFVIVAARYLGDRDFGQYSLAYFFAGLLTIFSDLGLNTVLIRDVSRNHLLLGRYAGNILSIKLIFSLASLILSPVILFLLGYSSDLIFMILLSQIYLQFNYLLDFFVALTNSLEKMEYELVIKGLYKGLVVAIPIIFLWLGYGLWGFLLTLVGAYGISCFLSGWITWKKITPLVLHHETDLWKQILRSAWPIGLSSLFMIVYARIDMVMLSLFGFSPSEIGWYSIPVKILEIFSLFPFLIMAGLFPIFSVLTFKDREAFKRSYQKALIYLTMVSIPLVLTTFFLSDSLVLFFFGPTFANSTPSLKILILAVPFIFINYVLINTLIVLNQGKIITWGSGVALIFNVVINVIVLPGYGYLGASWTTVATEILLSICFLGFLQHFFLHLPLMGFTLKLGVSGGLMGLSLWGLKSCPSAVVWITAFMAYGLGLVFFRLVTREDWRFLKQIMTQPLAKPGAEPGVES
ncbi:MAG: flippase [Thermodesulfobacteriota bacterium]|jgi:O-antigen/teichoic acid export membrane protein